MKKYISLFLVILFAFLFVSCSNTSEKQTTESFVSTEYFTSIDNAKKESNTESSEITNKNTTIAKETTSSNKKTTKNSTEKEKTTKKVTTTKKATTTKENKSNNTVKCTITIECADILDNIDDLAEGHEKYIVNSGYLVNNCSLSVSSGSTVYDVLKKVCDQKGYYINKKSSYTGIYVAGINQIDEFDCGSQSGWLYYVNGKTPSLSASKYTVKDGDNIKFHFTCSYS